MIEFSELKIGYSFHVPFFQIKASENEKELNQKYSLRLYQTGYKKSLVFIKDSEDSCYELITKTRFNLIENKMVNEEIGLSFYGNFVDVSSKFENIDSNIIYEYFEELKILNSSEHISLKRK